MARVRSAVGVFACVLPLAAQADDLRAKVSRALDAARPALMAHLKDATEEGVRPGQLALMLLAAVHDGVPANDPVFAAAVERLAKANPEETYDLALRLLVMEAFADFPDRAAIAKRDARELLTHRDDSGAFSYGREPTRWDLSNTQYAALGLRAAKALGATIERGVWTKLAREIGEQQDSYGGFGYVARQKRPANARTEPKRPEPEGGAPPGPWAGDRDEASYASMTAAGIAVLAICRQALGEEEVRNSALAKGISRGWTWFDRHVDSIGSPNERWCYYFHYGLERAAILCDVEKVAGKDWYALGAEMLVRDQLGGGGWNSPQDGGGGALLGGEPGGRRAQRGKGQPVSTAFAVLFLRRKFQKLPGPTTPRVVVLAAIGPNSHAEDIEAAAADLVRRGKPALREVLSALHSEIEAQRRVAVRALGELVGDTFGYDPARDAEANHAAIVKAELWYLRNR